MHEPPLILLVDDDPQIQDLYSTKLKSEGFTMVQARNGLEGVEKAKAEKPDLILLDILMPVMDGAKTLLELKADAATKDIPVVILTSLEDRPEDVRVAKEVGAGDFVNKDIDFAQLVEKINSILHIAK